ncbi:glutathione synthase [Algicola sagamiensis]|uniref:glutathione synthase n=1 Tax=Algicola sagamiensis TaxID=163869 RepID=UPI0003684D8A|nr:glutathione synthase [Algicola sagamiensis]
MTIKLGVVMDPIQDINLKKDSTFAMLLEAQRREYEIYYMEMADLFVEQGIAKATAKKISYLKEDPADWFGLEETQTIELGDLHTIFMRKDPPFDTEFIYATYILERAEAAGSLIVNKPQSLRDANEKLYTAWFAEFTPKTLVTRSTSQIKRFYEENQDIILKPLDGMGGASIFRVKPNDPNLNVIIETLTEHGQRYAMAQEFLPDITEGDKRVLVVDGEPIPYTLARIPAKGETRGNLAAGGSGVAMPITEQELAVAKAVGPTLKEKGLIFVGLDMIGGKLTEINVTSPTCIREIEAAYENAQITHKLFDAVESKI